MVFGSLSPHGADLDVVARHGAASSISAALTSRGFVRCRSTFVHLEEAASTPVEVAEVTRWGLDDVAEKALFEDAIPLDGFRNLARPAPHHTVLLLARRVVEGGALDQKRRARLAAALAEAPGALAEARRHERGWGLGGAVDLVERPARTARFAVLSRRAGRGPLAVAKAARQMIVPAHRRGHVVSLSGLDGAGKSTQAALLAATLERVGVPAVVEWSRLAHEDSLRRMVQPVKRAVGAMRRRGAASSDPGGIRPADDDPVRAFRSRSELLTHLWTIVVVLVNVSSHRGLTSSHLRAGKVVICDRYVLDSVAHLHAKYGEQRRYRVQVALLRALSPRPIAAFLLDVPAAAAYERKPERYGVEQLERQARLYRDAQERLGATRLDGTRPPGDLAVDIARRVWEARC